MNPEFIEDNKDFLGLFFYDHIKNFNHNEIVIYVICLIVFYYLIKTVYLIFLSYIQSIFIYEIKKRSLKAFIMDIFIARLLFSFKYKFCKYN